MPTLLAIAHADSDLKDLATRSHGAHFVYRDSATIENFRGDRLAVDQPVPTDQIRAYFETIAHRPPTDAQISRVAARPLSRPRPTSQDFFIQAQRLSHDDGFIKFRRNPLPRPFPTIPYNNGMSS